MAKKPINGIWILSLNLIFVAYIVFLIHVFNMDLNAYLEQGHDLDSSPSIYESVARGRAYIWIFPIFSVIWASYLLISRNTHRIFYDLYISFFIFAVGFPTAFICVAILIIHSIYKY